ncbi:MAG: hypothetical protein EB051_01780 [Chlamydiia bacterium]|nr:hypothetical protein [Chlamydiia bacterium]
MSLPSEGEIANRFVFFVKNKGDSDGKSMGGALIKMLVFDRNKGNQMACLRFMSILAYSD